MGVAPTPRLICISTERRVKELIPSDGIQFPTGAESWLSALMEHAVHEVWIYPSGIRARHAVAGCRLSWSIPSKPEPRAGLLVPDPE